LFHCTLPPGLPSRTFARTISSEPPVVVYSFSLFFHFCAVRWTKLAIVSFEAHV